MPETILSCDWGTTHVRLRRVDVGTGRVLAQADSDRGVKRVFEAWRTTGADRRGYFLEALEPLLETVGRRASDRALVVSGMASSSVGIEELPYADVPFPLHGSDLAYRVMEADELDVPLLLLSGVRTTDDVMRGEETQLLGLWRSIDAPAPSSFFILPGTHSKHVRVEAGAIADFRTYLTGELFDVLTNGSILRESVTGGPFEAAAFERGVRDAQDQPLLGALFRVRTNTLFERLTPAENHWYLSGLLVGAELRDLAEMTADPVYFCGMSGLTPIYRRAFDVIGAAGRVVFVKQEIADAAASAGHVVAYRGVLADRDDAGA